MFVAAPVKERCFAASQRGQCWLVGSYIHANRPRRGNKRDASAIHLSKAFFEVILWLRHKRGGGGGGGADVASTLHGGPSQKRHRDVG